MFGGGMVGLQFTNFKTQLGSELNGIVNYDFWEPAKTMQFPGVLNFLKVYQAAAAKAGVDPLGYYLPPFAYAYLQVLGDAVTATKSLDQDKIAAYLRSHSFKTVVGEVRFGPNGEWAQPRVLEVQFHGIKGHGLDQFKTDAKQTILWPRKYATGEMIYPYTAAAK